MKVPNGLEFRWIGGWSCLDGLADSTHISVALWHFQDLTNGSPYNAPDRTAAFAPANHSPRSACRHPQWRRDQCGHRWWCRCHHRRPWPTQNLYFKQVSREAKLNKPKLLKPRHNELSKAQVARICASLMWDALLHASVTWITCWYVHGTSRNASHVCCSRSKLLRFK